MSAIFDAGVSAPARTLRVRSDAIAEVHGVALLEPVRLSGREGVNSLFEYELLLKTTTAFVGGTSTAELNPDSLLGREVCCSIALDGKGQFIAGALGEAPGGLGAGVREINALVTHAAPAGQQGRHTLYRLTLRPWLHLATLTTDCKVFQNKTAIEVLDELLADYVFPVDKRLYGLEGAAPGHYPRQDYCVQFNESDFEFFERVCQEWGISYHFEHGQGKHRLVLSDAMASFRANPSAAYQAVEFHPPGWKVDAEYIHRFEPTHALTSGQYSTRDYDYTQPRADLTVSRAEARPTAQAQAEVYQWHASRGGSHYAQPRAGADTGAGAGGDAHEQGRHLALLRMQALRTHGRRAQASGNLRAMVPGCTFRLGKHPQAPANAEYLILETTFLIEDVDQASQSRTGSPVGIGAAAEAAATPQHWCVQVDFTAHPVDETLRPQLTRAKPHTHGPQTALVVGPEGQNLWTDELGRIKVQFPWDRLGGKNEHSSCWVRVSSPWAGNQLGGVHVPRIGQEVIVDFIGGDPDLPICTGRVHNQVNLPPWSLPGQSALSGFRSRELTQNGGGNSAAGRSNHLVLDDTEGKIQAQLKSDHLHSEVNLGHIGRIQGHVGRAEDRGEGLELRTDGHGVVRAGQGLVLSTDAREKARGPVKDLGEPVQRLTQARERHEALANLAGQHKAQDAGQDQVEVSQGLKTQSDAIRGEGGQPFPELSQPHLVLTSPAGIQAATGGSTHIASGEHTAITSAAHTSVASNKSLLASALEAIRLFAHKAGIRIFAAKGPVQVQAQDDLIELVAKKTIELISTTDWVRLRSKDGISFETPGNRFLIDKQGFRFYTPGVHHVWAGDHQSFEPKTIDQAYPVLAPGQLEPGRQQTLREEHFVLLEHASGLRLPGQKYRVTFAGGRTVEGVTNERGETDLVQSAVAQVASIEVLRNAEDGVLARYEPWIDTPADKAYDAPVMEKRERKPQRVGGRNHPANQDEATSQGKQPTHASCEPQNWGMRRYEPKKGAPGQWEYPVARAYVNGIKPALMGLNWQKATWPLKSKKRRTPEEVMWDERSPKEAPPYFETVLELINTHVKGALAQGAFGLSEDAMPKILLPDDEEARDLGINPDDAGLKGIMDPNKWLLVACKAGVTTITRAAQSNGDVLEAACELASTLYHEARHAQQHFWMAALVQQHPSDYQHLPNILRVWQGLLPADKFGLAKATLVPDEPSARAGLHRMLIATYYRTLCHADDQNKWAAGENLKIQGANEQNRHSKDYRPLPLWKADQLIDILPTEMPLARKAAYELLQDVGAGGLAIDVDQMARARPGSAGYRMQPWEEDAFACDELVKRVWNDDGSALLPEPGFCTNAIRTAFMQSRIPPASEKEGAQGVK